MDICYCFNYYTFVERKLRIYSPDSEKTLLDFCITAITNIYINFSNSSKVLVDIIPM